MKNRVWHTIQEYSMFSHGDSVLVGFSGGADSLCLLHLLHQFQPLLGITLHAVHVNHLLRGEESLRDQEFCRSFCKEYQIPLSVQTVDIAAIHSTNGGSIEEIARRERYRIFSQLAGDNAVIATAHTQNDSAETTLFHLMRGTGLTGLTGIPAKRDNIVRPLIECTRQEVECYCSEHQLQFVTDSSNLTKNYTRNRIRQELMPWFIQENPQFLHHIAITQKLLQQDQKYLQEITLLEKTRIQTPQGYLRESFLNLSSSIRSRLLKHILQDAQLEPSYSRITQMEETIQKGSGGVELSKEKTLRCNRRFFRLDDSLKVAPFFEQSVDLPSLNHSTTTLLPTGEIVTIHRVKYDEFENSQKTRPNLLKNAIICDKIIGVITLRTRRAGDTFRPAGRNGTKPLKKLFWEAAFSPEQRSRCLILSLGDDIIWMEHFGAASGYSPSPDTQEVFVVEKNL